MDPLTQILGGADGIFCLKDRMPDRRSAKAEIAGPRPGCCAADRFKL
jgi:hypothetical protein